MPKQRDSAESSPHLGITRRGDEVARKLLFMATMVHVTRDKDRMSAISRQYDRLCQRMPKKKALTAAANKMARTMYAILKSGERYEDRY